VFEVTGLPGLESLRETYPPHFQAEKQNWFVPVEIGEDLASGDS
jgi:hypothetical protein